MTLCSAGIIWLLKICGRTPLKQGAECVCVAHRLIRSLRMERLARRAHRLFPDCQWQSTIGHAHKQDGIIRITSNRERARMEPLRNSLQFRTPAAVASQADRITGRDIDTRRADLG